MLHATIDTVVKSLLLKQGKSVHYYFETLKHATDGLRMLNNTTLRSVNSKRLPVNGYKAVDIPCDYVDWALVGYESGERAVPLISDDSLNSLKHYEGTAATPYPVQERLAAMGHADLYVHTPPSGGYRFKVLPQRDEIQLSADYPLDYVLLDYISDGLQADAATKIDTRAQQCLEAWIRFRYAETRRTVSPGEVREEERKFNQEFKLLRAMLNNLTPAEVIAAVRSGYGR